MLIKVISELPETVKYLLRGHALFRCRPQPTAGHLDHQVAGSWVEGDVLKSSQKKLLRMKRHSNIRFCGIARTQIALGPKTGVEVLRISNGQQSMFSLPVVSLLPSAQYYIAYRRLRTFWWSF